MLNLKQVFFVVKEGNPQHFEFAYQIMFGLTH